MTQDAERIFLEAVELPPARRPIFLLEHCSTDELRREVESLLAGDDIAESAARSRSGPRETERQRPFGPQREYRSGIEMYLVVEPESAGYVVHQANFCDMVCV